MRLLARKRVALVGLVVLVLVAPETRAMWPAEPGQTRRVAPGLFLTVYDWGLGGINCDGDCSNTALTTTVVTIWGEEFWCIDAFGRPEDRGLTWREGQAVYRIDIAFRPAGEHPWNMEWVPAGEWSRERRWMDEFEALREAARVRMEVELR